jgi:hypothetical protein
MLIEMAKLDLCAVTPTAVAVILLSLVCVTTTLYFFAPPASIARGKVSLHDLDVL